MSAKHQWHETYTPYEIVMRFWGETDRIFGSIQDLEDHVICTDIFLGGHTG